MRPFGTIAKFEEKLYIQTGHIKPVYEQMIANPKIEMCAFSPSSGSWLRVTATAVRDDRREARAASARRIPLAPGQIFSG